MARAAHHQPGSPPLQFIKLIEQSINVYIYKYISIYILLHERANKSGSPFCAGCPQRSFCSAPDKHVGARFAVPPPLFVCRRSPAGWRDAATRRKLIEDFILMSQLDPSRSTQFAGLFGGFQAGGRAPPIGPHFFSVEVATQIIRVSLFLENEFASCRNARIRQTYCVQVDARLSRDPFRLPGTIFPRGPALSSISDKLTAFSGETFRFRGEQLPE